ncbi:MAG: DNA repair protein RadC [Lachnospiraceae bacterium]|jgi:DNA repair protein RadC|nr:DNA repair protein RadC [Lachnospiraceae bacterium]
MDTKNEIKKETKRKNMKDLPAEERPYERCLKMGPEHLTDSELLAVIIRTGSTEETSLELAQKILALNYPNTGILGLLHLSLAEFMKVKGIGKVKAIQLLCVGELSRRIWRQAAKAKQPILKDPPEIANYCMEDMRHLEQEQVRVLFFDTKQHLLQDTVLSKGTVNASAISPREIFIEALRCGAVALILVHNHPSGDPTPSRNDELLTRRVLESGQVLGILLLDHIIIGDTTYISLRERGII